MGYGLWVIPKSSHVARIQENFASLDCALVADDYTTIARLRRKYSKRFNNPSESWGVPLYEGLEGA